MYDIVHIPADELAVRAARWIADVIRATLAADGVCVIGLSGGSTPGPVYAKLGEAEDIDWKNVHVFLIDDRCVAPEDRESNQRIVRETLLVSANIPSENIVFPETGTPLPASANEYDAMLRELLKFRSADVVVLGMGSDGHIASLFPQDRAAIDEAERFAIHTTTERFAVHDRITVTIPVLRSATHKLILLSGDEKLAVFEEMQHSEDGAHRWPLKAVGDAVVMIGL